MDGRAWRTVLLVRSVEETDRDGGVLPLADRAEATRAVLRDAPGLREELARPDPQPALARFLRLRAERLLGRLAPRHPALATLADGGTRAAWLGRALLVGAFALGLGLSALDRSRLVNVLAFPLAGLVLWNLLVYAAVLAGTLRRRPRAPALATAWERRLEVRLGRWLRRSEAFDATLARALQAFAVEWHTLARPQLVAHATRLFHVAAAVVALGLVAGLYWRGLTLEYRAGWESTFLTTAGVQGALAGIYGPASALTGIPLPRTAAAVEALRWRGGAGGELAAPWIHLIAATALLYVVVPRLLLALGATLAAARHARRLAPTPALNGYARELLAGQGVTIGGQAVDVVPYAFEPPPGAERALGRLLEAALGTSVRVAVRPAVAYGDEDAWLATLERAPPAPRTVVLANLAGTPEAESHGALLAGLRDALAQRDRTARLLVIVDATAYARRMGEGALAARVAERARTWVEFVHAHGADAAVVDLGRLADEPPDAAAARVREELSTVRR